MLLNLFNCAAPRAGLKHHKTKAMFGTPSNQNKKARGFLAFLTFVVEAKNETSRGQYTSSIKIMHAARLKTCGLFLSQSFGMPSPQGPNQINDKEGQHMCYNCFAFFSSFSAVSVLNRS